MGQNNWTKTKTWKRIGESIWLYAREIDNGSYKHSWEIARGLERRNSYIWVFINLEKAYDKLTREVILQDLEKKYVHKQYTDAIKIIYERAVANVRTIRGEIIIFSITVGLRQGITSRLYMFALL